MPHNLLRRLSIVGFATVSLGTACLAVPSSVRADGPPCLPGYKWDPTLGCIPAGPGGGNLDAACQATAKFEYCQGSVYVGCKSWGFATACRLLQLSHSDPQTFQQIMNAQTACNLDGNQQACDYLQQYKGYYF